MHWLLKPLKHIAVELYLSGRELCSCSFESKSSSFSKGSMDLRSVGEVDLDSSPGLDGITYRLIRLFWGDDIFKKYYLAFLNYINPTIRGLWN